MQILSESAVVRLISNPIILNQVSTSTLSIDILFNLIFSSSENRSKIEKLINWWTLETPFDNLHGLKASTNKLIEETCTPTLKIERKYLEKIYNEYSKSLCEIH